MTAIEPALLSDLATLLHERTGLAARADGHLPLRLALTARLRELGARAPSAGAYVELLRSPAGEEEMRRLLPLVTVGKTSFFRDERQFRALAALLPGLLRAARDRGRPAAVWSAGCATGEEVWSIAMTGAGSGARPGELEVLGTDVNPEAIAAAVQGRYDARRIRDVPAPLLERWFAAEGTGHRTRPELRRLVADFRAHNLVGPEWPAVPAGGWDAIFCRNVVIYFDAPTTRRLLGRFMESLAPGGWLFLGYSESLFRLFDGFELVEVEGAFVYRRPAGADPAAGPGEGSSGGGRDPREVHEVRGTPLARPAWDRAPDPARAVGGPGALAGPGPGASSSGRAAGPGPSSSGRAAGPGPGSSDPAAGPGAAPADGPLPAPPAASLAPQEVLTAAAALLGRGAFAEARALLEAHLARGEHLGLRLTLANLYGLLREAGRARDGWLAAVAAEPLCAEAHLFFGVHLLDQGEVEDAARELSRALFLDPDLAMGHYFLGRCREAQRDAFRARLCYRNAVDAWERMPEGTRHPYLGHYPDLPDDGAAWARAAERALGAL
jgi:chemotaxis protein methyltransferase CheR